MNNTHLGVYLHIPFCRHRCDYCAFATWTDRQDLENRYLAACRIHAEQEISGELRPSSVFVGGGTPSLVDPETLGELISSFHAAHDAEITIECNPDDVTDELVATYVRFGVNRISLGVQSMEPSVLRSLGRTHDPANVYKAVASAKAHNLDVNIDLIYGAHRETVAQWESTLDQVIALEPAHVSAYALTVEPGTPLARDTVRHPNDDDQAAKYEEATARLAAAGYDWYEISNWAKPEKRCRHNLTYWLGGEYVAVGCAAHGYRGGTRYWNRYTPERYIEAIESDADPTAGSEHLSDDEQRLERLVLLIRTGAGVPVDSFNDADLEGPLRTLVEQVGPVEKSWGVGEGARLVLTRAGRLLANEVAIRLR